MQTTTVTTSQEVTEILEEVRGCRDRSRRRELRWAAVQLVAKRLEPEVRKTAGQLDCTRWSDQTIYDVRIAAEMRMFKASRKLGQRRGEHVASPAAYLAKAGRYALTDCLRPRTHDEMPASTKADWEKKGKKVPKVTRVRGIDGERLAARQPDQSPEPTSDDRLAVALTIIQSRWPEATLETLADYVDRVEASESAQKTLKKRAALQASLDQSPEEWAAAAAEQTRRAARRPKPDLAAPTGKAVQVTLFGEEIDAPKAKARQGTHKKRDTSHPGLFDEQQQLPPPEQEGPDLGLAM